MGTVWGSSPAASGLARARELCHNVLLSGVHGGDCPGDVAGKCAGKWDPGVCA